MLELPQNTSLFAQEAHDPSERVNAVYALETFSNVFLGEMNLLSKQLFDEIGELFDPLASRDIAFTLTHATGPVVMLTIVMIHCRFLMTSTLID